MSSPLALRVGATGSASLSLVGDRRLAHFAHPKESMSDAPALTVLPNSSLRGGLSFDNVGVVEIVAPDQHCAALLQDFVAPLFPAEIVTGSSSGSCWIVRFEPPLLGGEWVVELLSLVERWLESAPVPCARVRHRNREYLLRAPIGVLSGAHGAI